METTACSSPLLSAPPVGKKRKKINVEQCSGKHRSGFRSSCISELLYEFSVPVVCVVTGRASRIESRCLHFSMSVTGDVREKQFAGPPSNGDPTFLYPPPDGDRSPSLLLPDEPLGQLGADTSYALGGTYCRKAIRPRRITMGSARSSGTVLADGQRNPTADSRVTLGVATPHNRSE